MDNPIVSGNCGFVKGNVPDRQQTTRVRGRHRRCCQRAAGSDMIKRQKSQASSERKASVEFTAATENNIGWTNRMETNQQFEDVAKLQLDLSEYTGLRCNCSEDESCCRMSPK